MLSNIINSMGSAFKMGQEVMYRMLGELKKGTVIKSREDGAVDVRSEDGKIIPNINWYDPQQKRKPWYIVQVGKVNRDPKVVTEDESQLRTAFEEQKQFMRGKVKK